jgi:hypothetical protein
MKEDFYLGLTETGLDRADLTRALVILDSVIK